MSERLKWLGRLEQRRLDASRLELQIRSHLETIRDMLDPHVPIEDVRMREAAELAVLAAGLQQRLLEMQREIRALRMDLGVE